MDQRTVTVVAAAERICVAESALRQARDALFRDVDASHHIGVAIAALQTILASTPSEKQCIRVWWFEDAPKELQEAAQPLEWRPIMLAHVPAGRASEYQAWLECSHFGDYKRAQFRDGGAIYISLSDDRNGIALTEAES